MASQTSGTATAAQILSGKTAWVGGSQITGSMTDRGAVSTTLTANGTYTIPAGYHNGSGKVTQSLTTKAATTWTPTTSNQTIAAGTYCSGAQTIKGDANLVAGNIKKGTSIFGVTGTYDSAASLTKNAALIYDNTKDKLGVAKSLPSAAYMFGIYFKNYHDDYQYLWIPYGGICVRIFFNSSSVPTMISYTSSNLGTSAATVYSISDTTLGVFSPFGNDNSSKNNLTYDKANLTLTVASPYYSDTTSTTGIMVYAIY